MEPRRDDRSRRPAEDATRPQFGPGVPAPPTRPETGAETLAAGATDDPRATRPLPPLPPRSQVPTSDSDPAGAVLEAPSLVQGEPVPGQVLFGRYRAVRRLGRGGMGSVWLVHHLVLDADRALKLIVSNIAYDPQARARFGREARVMARLVHPGAVTVHDARLAGDVVFIEMEYVAGKSLNQLLQPGVPQPLDWTARILEQLCDVLQAAHDLGIVHRDLKPSNLMLLDGRTPGREHLKVLDFGIAKILSTEESGAGDEQLTRTGAMPYTPQYASPEQITGEHIDTRSDLYSLGIILYEFLTGHRPFTGPQVGFRHLTAPPPRFAEVNPEVKVPPAIEALTLRALSKDPAQRPPTARALWEEFLAALPSSAMSGTHFPTPLPMAKGPGVDSQFAPPPLKVRRSRRRAVLTVLAFLAIASLIAGPLAWHFLTPEYVLPQGYLAAKASRIVAGRPDRIVHEATGMELVLVSGGEFEMAFAIDNPSYEPGDEPTAHSVRLSDYYLQVGEVTNGMLAAYFAARKVPPDQQPPRWLKAVEFIKESKGLDPAPFPAVGMSWDVARAFARWAGGDLPTEAQWEYAARSRGKKRLFVWEEPERPSNTKANINSAGEHPANVVARGTFAADVTEQGISDLTGNAREWCLDILAPYPHGETAAVDPKGPDVSSTDRPERHVIRGGSFLSWSDGFSTTGPRYPGEKEQTALEIAEDGSAVDVGFRIALPAPPAR